MIVMKFGGTSVESAAAIERVAGLVQARLDRRPAVVVSAMGKTTNRLLAILDHAVSGRAAQAQAEAKALREYHEREAIPLVRTEDVRKLSQFFDEHFSVLHDAEESAARAGEITPELSDEVASLGERMSSMILCLAFRKLGMAVEHVDSRRVVVTDGRHGQAFPIYHRTFARMRSEVAPLLERHVVVMGGFIGATVDGKTTTLGRGGSDFSASIVGAGIGAEEIQIWTDVDGMLTADPRIMAGGRVVKRISFAEAAELAYFGAKVLHPATVQPAIEKNIPVRILNSKRPESTGTLIVSEVVHSTNPIKSIACKRGITIVNIQSLRMLMAYGFLRRIFEVFDRFKTPVDMVATSEVSVSLTIDDTSYLVEIEAELRKIADVSVVRDQAIICMVGDALRETSGLGGRIFGVLKGINVRMISHGASARNVSFAVDEDDLEQAVRLLHGEFFDEVDAQVFE